MKSPVTTLPPWLHSVLALAMTLGALTPASLGQAPPQLFDALHRMLPPDRENTEALVLSDMDGDGDADLVLGGWGQTRLYRNDGTGLFTDATATHLPVEPADSRVYSLAVDDVDGDGDLDLALGTAGGHPNYPNRLYLNDGTGHFVDASAPNLPLDSDDTMAIVLGDVDADGDPDLVLGNGGQNRLYLNDGLGVFTDATPTSLPFDQDGTVAVALADVDGDGAPDLVVGNRGQQNRLYLNVLGVFVDATATHMPVDADPTSALAVGDVDGDGDADLVVGNSRSKGGKNGPRNRLYLNDGSGVFSDVTTGGAGGLERRLLPVDADDTECLALGDVDGDGDLDLALGNWDQQNRLYRNNGAGVFVDATDAVLPSDSDITMALALGDVDGDGDLDLALGNQAWSHLDGDRIGETRLYLNDGTGSFADVTSAHLRVSCPTAIQGQAVGDVDGDGDLDLALACGRVVTYTWPPPSEGERNRLYLNDGTGAFTDATAGSLPADAEGTAALALGDVDGDGDPDLVIGNDFPASNRLYLNDGAGVFTDASATNMPLVDEDATWALELVDVDADQDLDIVLANGYWEFDIYVHQVPSRLYINDGAGVFRDATATNLPATSPSASALAVGDVDGDGDADVVLQPVHAHGGGGGAPHQDEPARLWLNDGAGVFTDVTDTHLPVDDQPASSLALGDVDGDGDLDLVLGGFVRNRLYVNGGAGVFTDATDAHMPLDSGFGGEVALVDADGDGDLDLALGDSLRQGLYVNDGTGVFDDVTATALPALSPGTGALVAADLDADGDPDLALGSLFFTNLTRQLSWRAVPRVGKPLTLDLHGPPHAPWVLSVSTFDPPPVGGAGGLGTAAAFAPIASGFLDSEGRATYGMQVPNDPALAGETWTWWARVDGVATNREKTTFTDL